MHLLWEKRAEKKGLGWDKGSKTGGKFNSEHMVSASCVFLYGFHRDHRLWGDGITFGVCGLLDFGAKG